MKKLIKKMIPILILRIIYMRLMKITTTWSVVVAVVCVVVSPVIKYLQSIEDLIVIILTLSVSILIMAGMYLPKLYMSIESWERTSEIMIIGHKKVSRNASPFQKFIIKLYLYHLYQWENGNKELHEKYKKYLLSKPQYIEKRGKIVLLPNENSFRKRWMRHAMVALSEGWLISAMSHLKTALLGKKIRFYSYLYS